MEVVPWKFCNPYAERKKESEFRCTFCGCLMRIAQTPGVEMSLESNTGTIVWDGAYLLARYVETAIPTFEIAGKRVVELGCGTALVGLVAWLRGGHVTLTDTQDTIHLAQQNIRNNADLPLQSNITVGTIQAQTLLWGDPNDIESAKPPFDFIFGSEVVYHKDAVRDLLKTLRELSHQGTVVYLSYKPRGLGEDIFFLLLPKYGFTCTQVTDGIDPEFIGNSVKLFRLLRT
eukprot:comp9737_c0_seq1/m.4708 comp9737_c0_seq1/g.4708  ORF comp9737_c0_seq1/g.4708 comp9737_c0_seq1/m.4708 type:complete len:231 (-) comp9737_c0_seq1:428-1120(-)